MHFRLNVSSTSIKSFGNLRDRGVEKLILFFCRLYSGVIGDVVEDLLLEVGVEEEDDEEEDEDLVGNDEDGNEEEDEVGIDEDEVGNDEEEDEDLVGSSRE